MRNKKSCILTSDPKIVREKPPPPRTKKKVHSLFGKKLFGKKPQMGGVGGVGFQIR